MALLAGCGSAAPHATRSPTATVALQSYLAAIEPLRLGVNRLLDGADPILNAMHARRISRRRAADRMAALERRFADYMVAVASVQPASAALRELHAPYAHTYVLEDAYLSALVTGISEGKLDGLPHTQDQQRAAIIQWRTGLTILAHQAGVALPADLQQAGRGEIAPAPSGS